jgi:predicted permease
MSARWRLGWRALTRRRRFEDEISDEFAFHLDARRDDLVAQGWSTAQASRQARIELGAIELHRDDCRRARGLPWFDHAVGDLRYALRGLRRNPGYSVTALLVLGLAIAANAVLFALFNAYALRNPPIERPQHWVAVDSRKADGRVLDRWTEADADALLASPPDMFEGLYAFRALRLPVIASVTRSVSGQAVSDGYFELFGVRAARGRTLDASPGHEDLPPVVLSDVGWQRLLLGDADVLGRTIEIAGRRFAVIGVLAPGFAGVTVDSALVFIRERDYRTLPMASADSGHPLRIDVGGFLREGASRAEAAAALTPRALAGNAAKEESLRIAELRVESRRGYLRADEVSEIVLIGVPAAIGFALLLLVAASNLANLVLARFAARQRELAVRAAVGAPRRRLVMQLLAECALLAVAAAGVGFLVAAAMLSPLHTALFSVLGDLGYEPIAMQVDLRVFGYGVGVALLAALSFGGIPALIATAPWKHGFGAQPDPAALQRAGSSRLRGLLMVAQLAASVLLLVLASLAARNASRAESVALGYDPTRLIGVQIEAPTPALAQALLRLPQVEAVAGTSNIPLLGAGLLLDARVDERSMPLRSRMVDPGWFEVMQLEVQRGRALRSGDAGGAAVVVSRATADRLWPGQDPLGRTLALGDDAEPLRAGRYEVVGVVEDIVAGWYVDGTDASAVYFPGAIGQSPVGSLLLRVRDDSFATLDAIRRRCAEAAPMTNCDLMPLTSAFRLQRLPFLIASRVSAVLGWTALAISCLGLYGLVSYLMQQKRREIGVRLALGARSGRVAREMLGGAVGQIAWGLALGLPLAYAVARLVASLSEQLRSFDLASFVAVPLGLALLALAAAWIPARRTAAIAPTVALREE